MDLNIGFTSEYLDSNDLRRLGFRQVGENVRISRNSTLVGLENIEIGNNVRIDSYVVILSKRGQTSIGSNVHIEPSCSIVSHFNVQIGNFCTLSHGVRLFTASANYDGNFFTNVFPDAHFQKPEEGQIVLEDHVIVGGNSVVMPNVVIREGAAIGALSFVKRSVEGWGIYGGNPLRFIRSRNQRIKKLGEEILAESKYGLKND